MSQQTSTTHPKETRPDWFRTELGSWLLEEEKALCRQLVPDGYYPSTLQVGMSHTDLLDKTETGTRFIVQVPDPDISPLASGDRTDETEPVQTTSRNAVSTATAVVAEPSALPFGYRSHSLIVLPHQLDFCSNPHDVLREINQILIPEGCVVITGFNRFSLWGIAGGRRRRHRQSPWRGRYCRPGQIQDWLSLLGYDVVGARHLAYGPAMQSETWRRRLGFLEKAGDRWWPALGAAYVIVGRKREMTMVTGNRRRAWQQFIPAIARPAVQAGNSMPSGTEAAGRHHLRLVSSED